MSKIRTLNELQDTLDKSFAWRLKELDNAKTIVKRSRLDMQKTAIRCAVCISYAHWEGFVKKAAESYVQFVSDRRLAFKDLDSRFVAFGVKRHLRALTQVSSAEASIQAVEFFRSRLSDRAYLKMANLIDTESNLSSVVFDEIAVSIGIDPTGFSGRYKQIDNELLKRRNRIAHGEYVDLDPNPCVSLIEDVIGLIRLFKTQVEVAASSEAYRCT